MLMMDGWLQQLGDKSAALKKEIDEVEAGMVIRDPGPLRESLDAIIVAMQDIVTDQCTLHDLHASGEEEEEEENPFEQPLAYLAFARTLVPHAMLRPVAVLLFILNRSLNRHGGGGGEGEPLSETEIITRTDETLRHFGLCDGVSLTDLWKLTEDYTEQRLKLWVAVVGVLNAVGDQCVLPAPS
jgi:hypothetical protein